MADTIGMDGDVELADQLSFQLYSASRAMMSAYRRELQAYGLTYPQYLTLRAVWARDGSPVSDICAALDLDSGTVSPLISRLETEGLLVRERVGSDGRQVRVFCTDRGRELRAQLRHVPGGVAGAAGIDEDAFGALVAQLGTLREAVRGA